MKRVVERRKSSDLIHITVNFLNIFSWVVFLVALIIFHYARPEVEYFVYQLVDEPVDVRTGWLLELKKWLQITLYFCLSLSILTLVLNQFRSRRHSDGQRYSMYMLVVISVVFITLVSLS
ncbi:hypothetical protein KO505_12660 [Psychrosphaera sp. F3M07]|jgi:hypothetical protein|uniref:hypothetical protein n=1 Tax=Psychrosphaera sp. F3M07 TaxID=2841560 RepID=UPI001C097279|nr:hypothetical protein [Psychrosphaera sp. F3M07]MBU2918802.1 hypothetical protein [Psychrosphaera sp. F3M07]